jgi:murein DD-endopeptidase MepM/ murein hydrolase activator NlpD
MNLKKLIDLKNSAIYVTPQFPDTDTKRWKFTFFGAIFIVVAYTLTIAVFVTLMLFLTPAKDFIFTIETKEMAAQKDRVKELETKVIVLEKEMERFVSANRKLKMAIMLGLKDTVDAKFYDSLRTYKNNKVPREGGNIFFAFKELMTKLFNKQEKDSSYFLSPVTGVVVNKFDPKNGHMGIDFAVSRNTPIVAASGGTIVFADFTINDGYKIIIDHHNNYMTIYKHCSTLLKKERENVVQGETIALSGKSGENSSGYHLHFEIWYNNKAVDPAKILIN